MYGSEKKIVISGRSFSLSGALKKNYISPKGPCSREMTLATTGRIRRGWAVVAGAKMVLKCSTATLR